MEDDQNQRRQPGTIISRFLRRKPFNYNDSEHKLSLNVKQNGFGIQPYMHEILANKN